MTKKIFDFLLNQPKTYIPLLLLVIVQLSSTVGIEVTPEFKHSVEVILGSIAAYFMRRHMIKEKSMEELRNTIREELQLELKKTP